eukprot:gene2591-biopygen23056
MVLYNCSLTWWPSIDLIVSVRWRFTLFSSITLALLCHSLGEQDLPARWPIAILNPVFLCHPRHVRASPPVDNVDLLLQGQRDATGLLHPLAAPDVILRVLLLLRIALRLLLPLGSQNMPAPRPRHCHVTPAHCRCPSPSAPSRRRGQGDDQGGRGSSVSPELSNTERYTMLLLTKIRYSNN